MVRLPTDGLPAAEFLVRRLYRPIDVAPDARFYAVAETENAAADNWFWNDDNAKVLELMSRPEVWRRFPGETAEILRFVRSMCRGPFIFRRVASPRLDDIGKDGSISRYLHSLMQVKCDLRRGMVLAGVRFHDDRPSEHLLLGGNFVEFAYRGQQVRLPAERGIDIITEERSGHALTLRHSAELHFPSGWRQRRRLGRITYTYRFDSRSMAIAAEAALEIDSGLSISDVVLTIGHSHLDPPFYAVVAAERGAGEELVFRAGEPGSQPVDMTGAGYYAIRQGFVSGDALAIHSVPREPGRLAGIAATVRQPGKLDYAAARYRFPGVHTGARLVAAEHKLITTGGFYDRVADYAGLVRNAANADADGQAAYDLSISYDYGATLNALAKCFAVCHAGLAPAEAAGLAKGLQAEIDRLLDIYFALYVDRHAAQPDTIFSRELAFVILATATMYRATGNDAYRTRLRRMCDVLLDFEMRFDDGGGNIVSAFLMRKDSPRAAYVDCHSGVLLALTHAARHIDDPRLPETIERGLASYGLDTCRFNYGLYDTVTTLMIGEDGSRNVENALWNFKAGLTLRFLLAVCGSENPALQAIAARHRDRIALLQTVIRSQLAQSVSEHADGIELRCAMFAHETNSESQPWAMLGLIAHPCE